MRGWLLALLAALALAPVWLGADAPAWWAQRGVLNSAATADDYAVANQGQVKNIAKQGYEEIKAKLGSAGTTLDSLWASPAAGTDDYAAVNLGQLKTVAKPFYDQLIAVGYTTRYPWTNATAPADDYALANLGQVKNVFSFDLSAFAGANTLLVVAGDQQTGPTGQVLPQALTVRVVNAQGLPVAGVTVTFVVTTGTGKLGATTGVGTVTTISATSGLNGQASVYLTVNGSPGALNAVSGAITGQSVVLNDYVAGAISSVAGAGTVPVTVTPAEPTPGGTPTLGVYQGLSGQSSQKICPLVGSIYLNPIFTYDNATQKNSVDWTSPDITFNANGQTFDHYIIECQTNFGKWVTVAQGPYNYLNYYINSQDDVTSCKYGNIYMYRVSLLDSKNIVLSQVPIGRYVMPRMKDILVNLSSSYFAKHFFGFYGSADQGDFDSLALYKRYRMYEDAGSSSECAEFTAFYYDNVNSYFLEFNPASNDAGQNFWLETQLINSNYQGQPPWTDPSIVSITKKIKTTSSSSVSESQPIDRSISPTVFVSTADSLVMINKISAPVLTILSKRDTQEAIPLAAMGGQLSFTQNSSVTGGGIYLPGDGAGHNSYSSGPYVNVLCGDPNYLDKGSIVSVSGGGLSAYLNGTQTSVTNGGIIHSTDSVTFRPDGTPLTNNGVVSISITPVDPALAALATSFKVQIGPDGMGVNIPNSESSGAKYRKIALNGAPLSDEKPQRSAESDQASEETFIDALTLGLRHDTTDVYMGVPASDLFIGARRSAASEVWNLRRGLRVNERPDRPFGAGWTSNLSAGIEFSKMVGAGSDDPTNPDTATVTDENGQQYTFAILYPIGASFNASTGYSTTGQQFVPLPSSNHEQSTYLCTLTLNVDGSYTFARKFGASLTYVTAAKLGYQLAGDRISGSPSGQAMTYARLTTVRDRYGNFLDYSYASDTSLIPATIKVRQADGLGAQLSIAQNTQGLITDIWDPQGNKVHYDYTTQTYTDSTVTNPAASYTYSVLTAVTATDGQQTHYVYTLNSEPDNNTSSDTSSVGRYYHLDLASITDPLNHTYAFTYAQDTTKYDYDSKLGYYIKTGMPWQVAQVTLPDGSQTKCFNDSKNLKVQRTGAALMLEADYVRQNHVIDAKGNERDYAFTAADVEELPSFAATYLQQSKLNNPRMVYYQTMTITSYQGMDAGKTALGHETFKFSPASGMSVVSATDFSGNTTTYAYTDPCAGPQILYTAAGLPTTIYNVYSDPTSQTNALGQTKTFAYGTDRIMTVSIDEALVKTQWTVDTLLGRRTEEQIFPAGSATPVQDTTFVYGNANFPNFMTQKTVKKLSTATADPSWVTDLVTSYVPDTNGRLAQEITDPGASPHLNLVTATTYDANGNKQTTTDPRGNVTTFSYDARNRLVAVTYADHSQKQFFYDARGNKTEETDENGVATFWQYDALNRVVAQITDMDGSLKASAATTHVLTGTAASYRATNLHLVTTTTYDPFNAALTFTDPNGHATTMAYDALERLVSKTDALNHTTTYAYGANAGGSVFDSSGFKPTAVTDPRGYHTQVTYDALYRPVTEKAEYKTGVYATTAKTYDAVGNLTDVTDPLGTVTHTAYDALRRPTAVTEAFGTTLAALTTRAYASTGFAWQSVDPLGRVTATDYDAAGRPVKTRAPAVPDALAATATPVSPVTETRYDAAGNVTAVINPLLRETDYTYDSRNRRQNEQLPAVLDATTGQTARPVRTTAYDLVGNVIAVQDARGWITTTTYDNARRPRAVTAPPVTLADGTTVNPVTASTYDPAGNVLTVTDANARVTTNAYDALNRLTAPTDAAGITVRHGYDEVGNRTDVWDGLNQHTAFTYDGLNRNLAATDPAGRATTFTYDALTKTARLDALGHATTYAYDARHRLVAVTYAGRTQDNHAYTYDADNELLTVAESGKAGAADVAYAYDALGRQVSESSGGLTHGYAYDLANNRVKVTYGGTGTVLVSAYDELNRLSTLTENGRVTTYGYDLAGNRVLQQMPDAEIVGTRFDALGRQSSETTSKGGTGALVLQLTQAYDAVGNAKKITETYYGSTLKPRTVTNTYDAINRLTVETTAQGTTTTATTYTFDAAHNRTQKAVSTTTATGNTTVGTVYVYNNLNQLLTATTGTAVSTYAYDLNGNRATLSFVASPNAPPLVDTYGYDYENRLVTLAKATAGGAGGYAYVYDYRTRRVQRSETVGAATTVTKSVFSGGLSVSEYVATTLSPLAYGPSAAAEYIRGSDWGGGVGGLLYSVRAGSPSYKHYNSRGDVVTETNASASATWQASYEAFGTRTQEVGSTQDRQKANTKEEDPTGLLNEGFRYRDLATGSFITRDPLGFVDGPNMYAYVIQNPWSKFDPEGLKTKKDYEEIKKKYDAAYDEADKEQRAIQKRHEGDGDWSKTADGKRYDQLFLKKGLYNLASANAQNQIDKIDQTAKVISLISKRTVEQEAGELDDDSELYSEGRKLVATGLAAEQVGAYYGGRLAGAALGKIIGKVGGLLERRAIAQRIMNAERVGSGLKGDAGHRAASFLSREQLEAGKTFVITGGDGVERTLVQAEGGMNGEQGVFEYILDPAGKVTHQRFIPGGKITGAPNQ